MAGLTEAQKARIRAEEEARSQALAEERYRQQVREELEAARQAELEAQYRAQVRAELGTGRPTPPAPAAKRPAPPPAPGPAPPPAGVAPPPAGVAPTASRPPAGLGSAVGLWAGAGLLAAAAIALGIIAFTGGAGEASVDPAGEEGELAPPDIVVGSAALAPVTPARWDPAELGFEGIEVQPDGSVRKVPATGVRSLAELAASIHEERPPRAVVPESPLPGAPPPPAASRDEVAEVLRFVPPDAWIVVGVDGASLRGSRLLSRIFADLIAEAHGEAALAELATATGVTVPADLTALFVVATPASQKDSDEILLGLCGAFDGRAVARFFMQREPAPRWVEGPPVTWIEGEQLGAALGGSCAIVGAKHTFRAALSARTGNGALLSSRLGPTLRRLSAAPSGFALVDLAGDPARELGQLLPDLASASLLAVGVDARGGLIAEATLQVGDDAAATRILAALERARTAAPPVVALALSRVKASADGAIVRVALRATDEEALALYAALEASDP